MTTIFTQVLTGPRVGGRQSKNTLQTLTQHKRSPFPRHFHYYASWRNCHWLQLSSPIIIILYHSSSWHTHHADNLVRDALFDEGGIISGQVDARLVILGCIAGVAPEVVYFLGRGGGLVHGIGQILRTACKIGSKFSSPPGRHGNSYTYLLRWTPWIQLLL